MKSRLESVPSVRWVLSQTGTWGAAMMSLALILFGLISLGRLPVRELPDIDSPIVSVTTIYPSANAAVMETEVTERIEEAVNPVNGVKNIESSSVEGSSLIFIEFELDVEVDVAQNDVRSKIEELKQLLPEDAETPVVSQFDFNSSPIVTLALSGENWAMRDLTRLATETIKRRIENVSGVGNVTVVGGLEREIHVELIPAQLEGLGVTPEQVVGALRRENMDVPAGRVERGRGKQSVRVRGKVRDPQEFAGVTVAVRGGTAVRLGQVDVITTPTVKSLVAGIEYRLEIKFTCSGNIFETYCQIFGQV